MKKIGFLLLVFSVLNGFTQERLITVHEAVELGCNNNVELNLLYAQLRQKENIWHNGIGASPLVISYFKEGINSQKGVPCAEKRFTISKEFDFPLTTAYKLKALNKEAEAHLCKLLLKEREIKAEVKSKYVEVLYYLYHKQLMEKRYNLIQDLNEIVTANFAKGIIKEMDLLKTELQLSNADDIINQSEKSLLKAWCELFRVIGLPTSQQLNSVRLTDSINTATVHLSQIQTSNVHQAHPLYQALLYEFEASNYSLKESKSQIFPSVDISLYKQNYGGGYKYNGFEIGLSFPVFFKYKSNVDFAVARQNEIISKQHEVKMRIINQIESSWQGYSECCAAIDKHNNSTKNKILRLHKITLQDYQNNKTELSNYLEVLHLLFEQEQQHLDILLNSYIHLLTLEKFIDEDLIF